MRKKILAWLFGKEIDTYFELFRKYSFELAQERETIESYRELLQEMIKQKDDHLKTLDLAKKLVDLCKENGIDVNKI